MYPYRNKRTSTHIHTHTHTQTHQSTQIKFPIFYSGFKESFNGGEFLRVGVAYTYTYIHIYIHVYIYIYIYIYIYMYNTIYILQHEVSPSITFFLLVLVQFTHNVI